MAPGPAKTAPPLPGNRSVSALAPFCPACSFLRPAPWDSPPADSFFPSLFPGDARSACFVHRFDTWHLKRHPSQTVQSVVLSLEMPDLSGMLNVRVQFRKQGRAGLLSAGGMCTWSEKANSDVEGRPLFEAYRKKEGLSCSAATDTDGSSAVEGGDFLDGARIRGRASRFIFRGRLRFGLGSIKARMPRPPNSASTTGCSSWSGPMPRRVRP